MAEHDIAGLMEEGAHTAGYAGDIRIVAIDADPVSLKRIEGFVSQIEGTKYLKGFTDPVEGLDYLKEYKVDCVFLAIETPCIHGFEAAEQIEQLPMPPAVAFVTGSPEYSYDAWKTNAVAYIVRPFNREDVERAVGRARYYKIFKEIEARKNVSQKEIHIKCFPSFDVFVDGEIVEFVHGKVKEILAFLIYQQGNWCTIDQIVFSILERHGEKSGKQYYRTLMYRLKNVLEKYGIQFILETGYGRARVKPMYYTCEYYEYLKGKRDLFQGAFMGTYSWAEDTVAFMTRERTNGTV